jgi:hypothetical protein
MPRWLRLSTVMVSAADSTGRIQRMSTRQTSRRIGVLAIGMLLLVSCGGADGPGDTAAPDPTLSPPGDERSEVSVAEALDALDGTQFAMVGYLFGEHTNTEVFEICDLIAESYPPQCGGARMYIVDVDAMLAQLYLVDGRLEAEGTRSWTDVPVVLTGHKRGPDGFQPTMPEPSATTPSNPALPAEPTEMEVDVVAPGRVYDVIEAPMVVDAVELHPVVPHRAVRIDDTTLELHLWGGVEPCWALQSVSIVEDEATVTITVLAGIPPDGVDSVCIMLAVEYSHRVTLSQPLGERTVLAST